MREVTSGGRRSILAVAARDLGGGEMLTSTPELGPRHGRLRTCAGDTAGEV